MQKIGIILIVVATVLKVSHCAPPTPPIDDVILYSMSIDELVNYYMENTVHVFYPKVPMIKAYIESILHLVDESAVEHTAGDYNKEKIYQYIREYIVEILISLKRRDDGCDFHRNFILFMHAIRYLIEDTEDQELLVEFKKQEDAMNSEIEWNEYYRNSENVQREIEEICYQRGCKGEFREKLLLKSC